MYQPTQADVVARKVAELTIGIYAAHDYLARAGVPETLADILRHLVVAGWGLGFNRTLIGDGEVKVVRILPDLKLPSLPVWPAAHAELKTSCRVRRVFDFLAYGLAAI
jgi:DNA-binding transcriptional LysR family regulator